MNFEVWHVEERKKLLTFTCGGGHRPWDFILNDYIGFVFIKKDNVYKLTLSTNRLKVISLSVSINIEIDNLFYFRDQKFVIPLLYFVARISCSRDRMFKMLKR